MRVSARMAALLLLFVMLAGMLSKALRHGGENAARRCNIVSSKSEVNDDGMHTLSRRRKMVSTYRHVKDVKEFRKLIYRENYGARFVAFTADYKGPKRHPPKNN